MKCSLRLGKEVAMNTKREIRAFMKDLRKTMTGSPESILLKNLFEGETYFVYRSFGSEASTDKLISSLKEKGKHVVTPRIEGKEMIAVEEGMLYQTEYGIMESDGAVYDGKIDVCIVPLLACDRQGYRIGYGGGYYDKFLETHTCLKIGLCFSGQVLEFIPHEAHDIRLDYLCTERELIKGEGK